MRVLNYYILRSFLGPFIATFVVMVFFLLMQFLWKYIDDLVGKGVEWYYILELLFYTSAGVVPLALPISVLLSSIMTFGNLGEYNELAAMKSAGISLFRIMAPLTTFMVFLCVLAFLFSNYVLPVANLKGESLLRNITAKKPALNIKEGVFYGGIEGYSIKIGEKYGEENDLLKNVYIYQHSSRTGNSKVVVAEGGRMFTTQDQRYLVLQLNNGHSYEEVIPAKRKDQIKHPFIKTQFEFAEIKFDLSAFQTGNLREERQKSFQMLNVKQLEEANDSLSQSLEKREDAMAKAFASRYRFNQIISNSVMEEALFITPLDRLGMANKRRAVDNALRMARAQKTYLNQVGAEHLWRKKVLARYNLEWHKKFSLAFAVMVLFFIGVPLGAIIRKGGMGLPVVISVIIFIIFHTMSFSMEKLGRELVWHPAKAMWLSSLILLPVGIFLTYKSATDSALFNLEVYLRPFENLRTRLNRIRAKNTHEGSISNQ